MILYLLRRSSTNWTPLTCFVLERMGSPFATPAPPAEGRQKWNEKEWFTIIPRQAVLVWVTTPIGIFRELLSDPDEIIEGRRRDRNKGRMVNHDQVIADLIGPKPATALPADYSLGSKSFEKLFGKDSVERKNCLCRNKDAD